METAAPEQKADECFLPPFFSTSNSIEVISAIYWVRNYHTNSYTDSPVSLQMASGELCHLPCELLTSSSPSFPATLVKAEYI